VFSNFATDSVCVRKGERTKEGANNYLKDKWRRIIALDIGCRFDFGNGFQTS